MTPTTSGPARTESATAACSRRGRCGHELRVTLAQHQPFLNGDKRAVLPAVVAFLFMNGIDLPAV
jgi:hypothetical protein